jgi:SSS family solute:Na+ symporter
VNAGGNLHLALLLGYSVLLVGLGLWIGRSVKATGDFFVAGRSLGPGLLFCTMLAANIGAGSTVGATGIGYSRGLSAWWWVGSAGIGSLVLAFTVGPAIRRLAAEHDLQTVGDYLEWRYNRSVRGLVGALLWVGTLAILAGQLIALAWVLDAVAGIPKWAGCLIGGVVMTSYFAAGGLLSSAWVNMVQLAVLLVGLAIALPMVLADAGGLAGLDAALPAGGDYRGFFSMEGLQFAVFLVPAFIISPGLLQKIYGARDDRAVRLGVGLNALVLLVFAFVPATFGMLARALHPGLENPELALPTLLTQNLPPLIGGIALAAVFSAEVSSADAILFMLATSLSRDLYRRFVDPEASDARVLKVARIAAGVGGGAGVAIAIVSPTVIGVLSIFYTLLSVSLFVPVVAGLYLRRVGTPEVLTAILGGVTLVAAIHTATAGAGYGWLTPAMGGLLAAALGCAAVTIARGGRRAEERT